MSDNPLPEADRVEGAAHPREVVQVFGQDAAESAFLDAYTAGRMHHAWLLTGPRGVGKATLAWRIARFLLTAPGPEAAAAQDGLFCDAEAPAARADSLYVDPENPVFRRIRQLAEPRLFLLRRGATEKGDRLASEILVREVRRLGGFFSLSAVDGGWRVVIVDAADDMTVQAANALLKRLEEPPARTVMLLVSHQPAALLPTIRSRCRVLRLTPLGPDDMARALEQAGVEVTGDPAVLTELACGSVGESVRLLSMGGLDVYAELVRLLSSLPQLDRTRALSLAEAAGGRDASERLDLLFGLMERLLSRLARAGATGVMPQVEVAPGEAEMIARLAPTPHKGRAWAACAEEIGARSRHGRAVNLDPVALVLDTVFKIRQTAAG